MVGDRAGKTYRSGRAGTFRSHVSVSDANRCGAFIQHGRKVHIFNGQELHRDKPEYQLCDIYDPLVRKYIDDPVCLKQDCKVSGSTQSCWSKG